jgi:hypothetical protein
VAAIHVTSPDLFLGSLLTRRQREQVVHNVVGDILHETLRLLEEFRLGFIVETWASGVRTAASEARHHSLKLATPFLLLCPWIGASGFVARYVLAATSMT